jgi:hypothetical protein
MASIHGHPSPDQIKHCFYTLINQNNKTYKEIIPEITLPKLPTATRGLSHYDSLLQGGVLLDDRPN